MPSLVILVCAAAGRWASARAPTARPIALNDFDITSLLFSSLARVERKVGASQSFAVSQVSFRSSHSTIAIHGIDFRGVALVHEAALQLHGRCQFLVLGRQLALDQVELLDGLDASEVGIHRLDLALNQALDLRGAAQARIVGEGYILVLCELLDVL